VDVQLRVPSALRSLAGDRARHIVTLGDGATVADLLDAVAARYPALARRLRDERGRLRPHVNVFVGAENVRSLAGAATVLQPGDEVSILAAISGG
jgi:molybdopterin synthase sulfur carrier subunit